jgi:hypothetical protein
MRKIRTKFVHESRTRNEMRVNRAAIALDPSPCSRNVHYKGHSMFGCINSRKRFFINGLTGLFQVVVVLAASSVPRGSAALDDCSRLFLPPAASPRGGQSRRSRECAPNGVPTIFRQNRVPIMVGTARSAPLPTLRLLQSASRADPTRYGREKGRCLAPPAGIVVVHRGDRRRPAAQARDSPFPRTVSGQKPSADAEAL